MDILNVFILAAGLGERLKPLTEQIPKPLLPIMGIPILQHIMQRIEGLPFKDIGINLHYMRDRIEDWIINSKYRERINIFYEEMPLGTGGALKNAERFLEEGVFLVHNSDTISDIDLMNLVEHHISSRNIATLAVHNHADFNNLIVDEGHNLVGLKRGRSGCATMAFTGIAVYSPDFLRFLPEGVCSVVEGWLNAISKGYKIKTYDVTGHTWYEIGTPLSYARTVFQMLRDEGERFFIHPSSRGCGNALLNGYVVIEEGCAIGKGSSLKNCIVLPKTSIADGAVYEDVIVCNRSAVDISHLVMGCDQTVPCDFNGGVLIGTGGSDRRYYRIKKNTASRIIMRDSNRDDFVRYIRYTDFFRRYSLPVPRIIDVDYERMVAIVEDLGDVTLYNWLRCRRSDEEIEDIYKKAVDILVVLHTLVSRNLSECPLLHERVFDLGHFRWEGEYFIEMFVKGIRGIESGCHDAISEELDILAHKADSFPKAVIHRDFQSQNIMVTEKGLRVIDYQGARVGPPAYDVVSLLYDPYYPLHERMREKLIGYYIEMMKKETSFEENGFIESLNICRLQRHMQALGAYGFLSVKKGKRHFLKFIPEGVRLLKEDIDIVRDDYRELYNLIMSL